MKKVVLITGAFSGIGKATAKRFLKEGHIVYAIDFRAKSDKDLEKLGGKTLYTDVRNDKQVKSAVKKLIKEQGRIDVLVNNAGYAQYGSLEDVTMDQARAQLETNTFAYARLIKEVLPHMRKQKSGHIINVTSTAGRAAAGIITWYNASKFALEGLLDALRQEVSDLGINVVMIEPGFIKTDLYRVAWQHLGKVKVTRPYRKLTNALKTDFVKRAKRSPTGEVIANAIYKASRSNNPKTRYVLPMDGKMFMFLKWIMPDKWLDKIFRMMFKV